MKIIKGLSLIPYTLFLCFMEFVLLIVGYQQKIAYHSTLANVRENVACALGEFQHTSPLLAIAIPWATIICLTMIIIV